MKNKILVFILLLAITIPQVASAAWWNPFSWKVFERIFTPKVEVFEAEKEVVKGSMEDIATTTEESEIEKLRAEIEELKNQKNIDPIQKPKASSVPKTTTETTKSTTISPVVVPTISVNYEEKYKKLLADYVTFRDNLALSIQNMQEIFNPLEVESNHLKYLQSILPGVKTDVSEILKIFNSSPKSPVTVDLYATKFVSVNQDYQQKDATYRINRIKAMELKVKETEQGALLEKQQYVQDLEVKIAEMDQLRVQIDTLAGSSLMPILNNAKKLDGDLLFYTFKYKCSYGNDCSFNYPYGNETYDNNYYLSNVRVGLRAIVANYRAFLNVELVKYE